MLAVEVGDGRLAYGLSVIAYRGALRVFRLY